jgi:hypothetical protein
MLGRVEGLYSEAKEVKGTAVLLFGGFGIGLMTSITSTSLVPQGGM